MSLQLNDVVSGYSEDIDILKGVSMDAEESKVTTIVGPNGAGKSTILKTVLGFLRPKSGSIVYNGENITGLEPHEMLGSGLAYVPQDRSTFPYLSVHENMMLGRWIYRKEGSGKRESAIEDAYERFLNLSEKRSHKAGFLSGGEQRMLEMARALVTSPSMMMLDEPTAGLAPKLAKDVYRKIQDLASSGLTILLVDQNVRLALEVADHAYVIELGAVSRQGEASEFRDNLKELIGSWFVSTPASA